MSLETTSNPPRTASVPSPRRPSSLMRWLPAVGPLALIVVWALVNALGLVKPVLLPSPWVTLEFLVRAVLDGSMIRDLLVTGARAALAFGIAAGLGVPLGVAFGSSRAAYRSVEFLVDFFRSTPASALIPLFLLLFGLGDENKVAIAAFAAFLTIFFNSAYGVMNARESRILAAKVMGANRLQVFRDVLLLESLPQTFVGLRSGVSLALVIVIVAEMFIGTEQGLGKRIIYAQQVLNTKDVYASTLVTGTFGYALNILFLAIERRFVHWSGR